MAATDLDYAKVVGRFALTVGDTSTDPDDDPDIVWCDEGKVFLQPLQTFTKVAGAADGPFTAGNSVIEAEIGADGRLTFHGKPYVHVIDLTSAKVNPVIGPNRATHKVKFQGVKAGGTAVTFPDMDVRLTEDGPDGDGVNDLTELAPVVAGASTAIYRGEQGTGIVGVAIVGGDQLQVELSDGTTVDAGQLPIGPGGSDVGVAGYIEDPESETARALTATIDGATKDALRDETAAHAAGTPTEFTSGQPLTVFGNAPLSIHADGYYTHTPAAVINSAGYVQADMGPLTADRDGVYHLGADVAWPTTDVAAIALVLADGAWTDTPSPVRSRAKVHAVFYGNGIMHVSDFNSGETKYMDTGAATTAAAYIPRFADVRGSATFRPLDVQFDPATGTITVVRPDGSSVTKTVAVLVGFKPRYAIWELFEPGASTPASARFKNMRSSVGPRVVGERATTRGDVGRIVNAAPVPVQLLKSRRSYRPASTDTITLPITTAAEIVGTGSVQITRLSAVVPSSGKLHARIRAYITTATARAVFINLVNTDDGSTIDSHRVIDGAEATGARWIDESFDISGMTAGTTRSIAFHAVVGSGTPSDVTITAGQTPSRQVEVELTPVG